MSNPSDLIRPGASGPWDPRLTVAVDFHGVICDKPPGAQGFTEMDWPERPGAIEWLGAISERLDVHLLSARFSMPDPSGSLAMGASRKWLVARGMPLDWLVPWRGLPRIILTPLKPHCLLWIDDRAWRFEGRFPSVEEILAYKPWGR